MGSELGDIRTPSVSTLPTTGARRSRQLAATGVEGDGFTIQHPRKVLRLVAELHHPREEEEEEERLFGKINVHYA